MIHHIRLTVGIEVEPGSSGTRVLDRDHCEQLASHLAEDLVRLAPSANQGLLSLAGALFEPAELLRPGLPAWQALNDLSRPVTREHGWSGKLLAIGANQGRMPDARLRPPSTPPQGHFLVLPMQLSVPQEQGPEMARLLEERLFEQGGLHPPARACLAETSGRPHAHAQLMTANDLIALQHVQMDTAGLGAFWPVVEHALIDAERDQSFDLPAGLTARWQAGEAKLVIEFQSFDQHGDDPDSYALWVRAFRCLSALIDSHGIRRQIDSSLDFDPDRDCLSQTCGFGHHPDGLTEHTHPDCGLIAWTLVEDGKQTNLYPLSGDAIVRIGEYQARRALPRRRSDRGICYDPDSQELSPAK